MIVTSLSTAVIFPSRLESFIPQILPIGFWNIINLTEQNCIYRYVDLREMKIDVALKVPFLSWIQYGDN